MDWLYSKGIPIETQYLYQKGLEMSTRGKTEMAMKYLRQAAIIAPGYSKAIYEMGNCFAKLGQYPEAIKKYQRAIHIDPSSPEPQEKMTSSSPCRSAGKRDALTLHREYRPEELTRVAITPGAAPEGAGSEVDGRSQVFIIIEQPFFVRCPVLKNFYRCDNPVTVCILAVSILQLLILPAGALAENATEHTTVPEPVLLWSVPNGDFNFASGSSKNIACPGDGSIVIAGYSRGIVGARNRNGDLLWSGHDREPGAHVWSVESSPEGKYTGVILSYAGSQRNDEFVYLDNNGNILWRRTLSENPSGISQSENGKIIAIPGTGNVSYFDETGKNTGISMTGGFPWLTATSDNGDTIAVLVSPSPYRLLLIRPGGTIAWDVQSDHAINLAISGDGRYVSLLEENRIRHFSSDGRELWNYSGSSRFTDVSVSKDGSYVAAGSEYYLRFFTRSGDLLSEYKSPPSATQPAPRITDVSISGNGDYVSALANTDLLFFDRNGTLLWLNPGTSFIYSTCMSSDGKYLGVATQEDFRYYDTGITSTHATSAAGPASAGVQDRNSRGTSESQATHADLPASTAIVATCALILITGIRK